MCETLPLLFTACGHKQTTFVRLCPRHRKIAHPDGSSEFSCAYEKSCSKHPDLASGVCPSCKAARKKEEQATLYSERLHRISSQVTSDTEANNVTINTKYARNNKEAQLRQKGGKDGAIHQTTTGKLTTKIQRAQPTMSSESDNSHPKPGEMLSKEPFRAILSNSAARPSTASKFKGNPSLSDDPDMKPIFDAVVTANKIDDDYDYVDSDDDWSIIDGDE